MKLVSLLLVIVFSLFLSVCAYSQNSDESLIRQLDNMEREAILKSDTIQLSHLMSRKIVVQNPENTIVGFQQVMQRIKSGKINYSSFERQIDSVVIVNGIAVIMGLETVIPRGNTQKAGKRINRRFTNIWTKENGKWKLTARQATIVSLD